MLFPNSRDVLEQQGLLDVNRGQADLYLAYREVIFELKRTLGTGTWEVEHLLWRLGQGAEESRSRRNRTAATSTSKSPPRNCSAARWATSYSRELRPDVTLRTAGGLHLFDAKLKLKSGGGAAGEGFESEDLHKMHAYRDALGATSVWMIYPAAATAGKRFGVPTADGPGFHGVGRCRFAPQKTRKP